MDHPHSHSPNPSLVCVGGMLRVAHPQPQPPPPPTPTQTQTQNVTPFKQLASPFTASAPFTAPTTPYYTTTPTHSTPLSTPPTNPFTPFSTTTQAQPTTFYSLQSPKPTLNNTQHDLQPQPQPHLLTQKQVRELRRLCRKTANRSQFEGRLTQIRQVASIAAMAASSIHLFDPGNPHSALPLRNWVETHRADGADWRDERPLSSDVVAQLRRWDLLLKAWARARFEHADRYRPNNDDVLKPVRLEFENISLASPSQTTPAACQKPRNVYSADFLRLASPVTPIDGTVNHLAPTSASASASASAINQHTIPSVPSASATPSAARSRSTMGNATAAEARSAWSKPPLTGLTRWVDSRNPLTEVSINRVGDEIKVTVPPTNANTILKRQDNTRIGVMDQENCIPAHLRRAPVIHASTTAKSWRNVLMQTPEHDDSVFGAAKTLFPGHDEVGQAARSPLDWGKVRRDTGQSGGQGVWQSRNDDA